MDIPFYKIVKILSNVLTIHLRVDIPKIRPPPGDLAGPLAKAAPTINAVIMAGLHEDVLMIF